MAVARALYAFEGSQEGDLSFQEDDIIRIIRQDESGWWEGQTDDGRRGDFPYNYVEIISPEEVANIRETSRMVTEGKYNRKNAQMATDYLTKAKVMPVQKSAMFQVELTTNKGAKITGTKGMNDFRILDENIRAVFPNFDRPLPPMWADKAFISEDLSRKRSQVLEIYLSILINQEVTEFTLVNWLNPAIANQYNVSNEVKNMVRVAVAQGAKNGFNAGRNSFSVAMMNVFPLARVEYEWIGTDAVELTFYVGDIIAIRNKETPSKGWWEGETSAGERGLFPYNHVRVLDQNEARSIVMGEAISNAPSKSKLSKLNGKSKNGMVTPPGVKDNSSKLQRKPSSGSNGRKRKTENNWALPDLRAFDELLIDGFTMLQGSKVFQAKDNANCPCEGDKVVLSYVAFVWDCQKQRLIEFSSSDLPDNGKGKANGPMMFTVGKNETIKALERAVQNMETGQELRIVVRPDLGFGEVGLPPNVPPNCHLVYDVKLESFEGAALPGPPSFVQNVQKESPTSYKMPRQTMNGMNGINIQTPTGQNSGNNGKYLPQGAVITPIANMMPRKPTMTNGGAKSLVDAVARQAKKVQESENSSNLNFGNQAPINARPKRQAPNAKKRQNGGSQNGPRNGKPRKAKETPKVAPPGQNIPKYDLKKMQEINLLKDYDRYQIFDPKFMEDQLTDEAFEEAFNCNRAAFLLMPRWKQNKLKKNVGLY